jgi:hypothetical protein
MKKLATICRKPDLVMSVVFFTFLLWGANSRPAAQVSDRPGSLNIMNRAPGFELLTFVKTGRDGRDIKLSFKNNYNKGITSYVLLMGENAEIRAEFYSSGTDWLIAPGAGYEYTITMPGPYGLQEDSLTIAAVVFDDRTGEGDAKIINEIMQNRLGKKAQITRALSVLKGFLESPDPGLDSSLLERLYRETEAILRSSDDDILKTLSRMKPTSMSIRIEPGEELTNQLRSGIQRGYEIILSDLRSLEELPESEKSGKALREKLIRIKDRYEKLLERL